MTILLLACLTKNKHGNVFGGAERSIINLANWLALHHENIILASVEGSEMTYTISNRVHFVGYEITSTNKFSIHFQMYQNTQKVLKKFQPDCVISFWIHPLFYAGLNPFNFKLKYIYSERNDPNLEYSRIAKLMRRRVMKRAAGVVFQNQGAKNYFDLNIQKKSKVIHNPVYISMDEYSISTEVDNRIVTVGRLNPQKNHRLLIDAFNEIKDRYPNIVLEIYGEGPLKSELQEMIDRLQLNKRVRLMGTFSDILDRIYGARLFVMTSLYEGMPNALMEAMSLGIPIICSDCPCGGPRELVKNGENGFLFKNGDKSDLVHYMIKVLDMKSFIDLSMKEKEICDTHSQESIFRQWNDYINDCI